MILNNIFLFCVDLVFSLSRLDIGECNIFHVDKLNSKNFEVQNLNHIDFFLQKLIVKYLPFTISEIIGYVFTIQNYKFVIDKTNYILYPTKKLVQLSGDSEIDIGYFDSVSVVNKHVVLKFYKKNKPKTDFFKINIVPHNVSKANLDFISSNGNLGYTLYMSELFYVCENYDIYWAYNSKQVGNSFLEHYFAQYNTKNDIVNKNKLEFTENGKILLNIKPINNSSQNNNEKIIISNIQNDETNRNKSTNINSTTQYETNDDKNTTKGNENEKKKDFKESITKPHETVIGVNKMIGKFSTNHLETEYASDENSDDISKVF